MNTKITAVYCRIHSEDKQAIDDQIAEINKYCSNNNLEATYYVDQGLNADYEKQPQFMKLHNDVLKGKIGKNCPNILISKYNFDKYQSDVKDVVEISLEQLKTFFFT